MMYKSAYKDQDEYFVIDVETTVKNKGEDSVGKFKASPYHPKNKPVLCGFTMRDCGFEERSYALYAEDMVTVGQNIKFDIATLTSKTHVKSDAWMEWLYDLDAPPIWDTMLVEYLLTGQSGKMASLNQLAESYGGTLKPDKIKEYWEAGVETEDIPYDELRDYLEGDVLNTENAFLQQRKIVEDWGMLPLVESQNRALRALTWMEMNGMHFDKEEANKQASAIEGKLAVEIAHVTSLMRYLIHPIEDINPLSTKQLSVALFGGVLTQKEDVPCVNTDGDTITYKSGQRKGQAKTKKVAKKYTFPNTYGPHSFSCGASGNVNVDDEVLKEVVKHTDRRLAAIASRVLYIRKMKKEASTYFRGYADLTWPDGKIHPNYLQCRTDTGRLSCTQPNLQNAKGNE